MPPNDNLASQESGVEELSLLDRLFGPENDPYYSRQTAAMSPHHISIPASAEVIEIEASEIDE